MYLHSRRYRKWRNFEKEAKSKRQKGNKEKVWKEDPTTSKQKLKQMPLWGK